MKTQTIHIMHVLGNFGMGGAEMGVLRLIQGLTNNRMRHSLVILGADRSLLEERQVNDIPCHALAISGRSYTAFQALSRLFRQAQADIVHVNNLAPWADAALGARMAGARCIETFHGVEQGQLSLSTGKKFLLRGANLLTTKVTAVGDEAADLLAGLTGLDRTSVQVIANGIDTQQFAPAVDGAEKRALRRSHGLPDEAILLGCVAALRPVKNHRGLLQAFANATRDAAVPAALVLVGDGPLHDELRELARKLGVEAQVIFLGRRTDVAELLQCFDAFVLNSDTEGLSYAVLEAMACGLPLIGTAVGAHPQLVKQGSQGLLVAPADETALTEALTAAVNDPVRLVAMGMAARKLIEAEYGIDAMIGNYRALYEETAGNYAE